MSQSNSRNRIQLAVYDLSRGMAAQMSLPLIGTHVEGIWHTGVVIFGYEYFFGGGIQKVRQGMFTQSQGLPPTRMEDMGECVKTEAEVDAFVRSIRSRFTPQTYDLLRHNCNNFSNELVIFCTGGRGSDASNGGREIPHYILHLAQNVFSTPGGAMIRPLIENMQNSINNSGGSMDAFGDSSARMAGAGAGAGVGLEAGAAGHSGGYQQPVAPAAATTSPTSTADIKLRQENQAKYDALLRAHTSSESAVASSEVLKLNHPLLSKELDPATMRLLTKKIVKALQEEAEAVGHGESASAGDVVHQLVEYLILHNKGSSSSDSSSNSTAEAPPPEASVVYRTFLHLLQKHPKLHMAALFILRVVVLRFKPQSQPATAAETDAFRALLGDLIQRLENYSLPKPTDGTPALATFSSELTYTMGLCVLSNCIGATLEGELGIFTLLRSPSDASGAPAFTSGTALVDKLVDIGSKAMQYFPPNTASNPTKSAADVQLTGSAVLFNVTMLCTRRGGMEPRQHLGGPKIAWFDTPIASQVAAAGGSANSEDELHSHVVQLLCHLLEELDSAHTASPGAAAGVDAINAVIRLRKLSIIYLLLRSHYGGKSSKANLLAKEEVALLNLLVQLVSDLEYKDKLLSYQRTMRDAYLTKDHGGFRDEEVVLLHEIIAYTNKQVA